MTEDETRRSARALAHAAVEAGEPLAWFETLYASAASGSAVVPWADLEPNPHLVSWPDVLGPGPGRALVVGCGYGDDAEWLSGLGWSVTAFDISATAVERCQERFPDSSVTYVAADLLALPSWEPFDLVVEIYTLQVLPPESAERAAAVEALRSVTGGRLLVIARGRSAEDPAGEMPWPLTVPEVEAIAGDGLELQSLEDFLDDEEPAVRRLRAVFARASSTDAELALAGAPDVT